MGAFKLYKIAIVLMLLIATVLTFVFLRKKRKEVALALGTIFFSLFVGELVLWRFFPQISDHDRMFEYDADLGWRFVPHQSGRIVYPGEVDRRVRINSVGFRDVERDLSNKSKRRVLVLGDSFVSNIAVDEDEVFTRVMERQLENTEVLNFGVNAYGQVQEYLLLQRWFDRVKPDVVMVVIYLRNDFQDNLEKNWTYSRPFVSLEGAGLTPIIHPAAGKNRNVGRGSIGSLCKRSHVCTLINKSLERILDGILGGASQTPAYTPPELFLCRKESSQTTDLMFSAMEKLTLKLNEVSSAKGVPMVFVLAPSHVQIYDDLWLAVTGQANQELYDRALPDKRLMGFAKDNHLTMIDLLPALLAEGQSNKSLYFRIEQHWTREGNELVARVLIDYLKSLERRNQ